MGEEVQDLTIRIKLDKTEATASSKQYFGDLRQFEKELLADEKQANRARAAMVKDTGESRKSAAREAAEVEKRGLVDVQGAAESAATGIKSLISGYLGVSGALKAVSLATAAWSKAADEAERAARAAFAFEKASRASGTLTGRTPEHMAPQIAQMMIRSGLDQGEADDLLRQFEGSLPAGLSKNNITREIADALLKEVAVVQARQHGSASTRGDLFGVLAQYGKVGSVEEGLAQAEAIRKLLSDGRGDDTPLTNSLLNVSGSLVRTGGPIGTLPELAAVVSTMSTTSGATMADTRTEQLVRALRGTDKRQMEGLQSQFGIPVGSKMGIMERLDRMVPKLTEVGKTQDIASWLTLNVGTGQEDARALVEAMGNIGVLRERMKQARDTSGLGASVLEANNAFLASPLGRDMTAESKKTAGTYLAGRSLREAQALLDESAAIEAAKPPTFMKELRDRLEYLQGGSAGRNLQIRLEQLGVSSGVDLQGSAFQTALERTQSYVGQLRAAGVDPTGVNQPYLQQGIQDPIRKLSEAAEKIDRAADKMGNNSGTASASWAPMPPPLNAKPTQYPGTAVGSW